MTVSRIVKFYDLGLGPPTSCGCIEFNMNSFLCYADEEHRCFKTFYEIPKRRLWNSDSCSPVSIFISSEEFPSRPNLYASVCV